MSMTDRAQGVLYGQVIGDSLGSLVEFASPDTIAADYPGGVRELVVRRAVSAQRRPAHGRFRNGPRSGPYPRDPRFRH